MARKYPSLPPLVPSAKVLRRLLLWAAVLIVFGVVVLFSLFQFFPNQVLGPVLRNEVQVRTQGQYRVDFDDLQINLLKGTLELNGMKLSQRQSRDSYKTMVELDRLRLAEWDYWLFISQRTFAAKTLALMDSEVNLDLEALRKGNNLDGGNKERLAAMRDLLHALRVRTLELNGGSLNISQDNQPWMRVAINRIWLDQVNWTLPDTLTLRNLEELGLKLSLREVDLRLPKVKHHLRILSVRGDLALRQLDAGTILFSPLDSAELPFRYNFAFSGSQLRGFSLANFLEQDSLYARALHLGQGTINIEQLSQATAPRTTDQAREPFRLPFGLGLDSLVLSPTRFKLTGDVEHTFSTELKQFQSTAIAWTRADALPSAGQVQFEVDAVSVGLLDQVHDLNLRQITYDSKPRKLTIYGVEMVTPETGINFSQPNLPPYLYLAQAERLEVLQLDLLQALQSRSLRLREVRVVKPNIEIQDIRKLQPDSLKTKGLRGNESFFALVQQYASSLTIDQLNVEQGLLDFAYPGQQQERLFETGFIDLSLTGFRLVDPADSPEGFTANDFELSLSSYELRLADGWHVLRTGPVQASSKEQRLLATQIRLGPGDSTTVDPPKNRYDLELPELELTGIKWLQALEEGVINARLATLAAPSGQVFATMRSRQREEKPSLHLYPLIENYLSGLAVDSIQLLRGNLELLLARNDTIRQLNVQNVSLGLENLLVNETVYLQNPDELRSENQVVVLEDYLLDLPDSLHRVQVKKLVLDTRTSSLELQGLRVAPLFSGQRLYRKLSAADRTLFYRLYLPQVRVEGARINEILYENRYHLDTVRVNGGKLQVAFLARLAQRERKGFSAAALRRSLAALGAVVSIGEVAADDMELEVSSVNQQQLRQEVLIGNIDVLMDRLLISDDEASLSPLLSNNIVVSVGPLKRDFAELGHSLSAKGMRLSTAEKNLRIDSLLLAPLATADSLDLRANLSLPLISLEGLDVAALLLRKELEAEQLTIPDFVGYLKVGRPQREESAAPISQLDFLQLIQPYLQRASLQSFTTTNGHLEVAVKTNRLNQTFDLKGIDLSADSLLVSEEHGRSLESLFQHRLRAQVVDYSNWTNDSLYQYGYSHLSFVAIDELLTLDSLYVRPRLPRYEHSEAVGHQTDRIELLIPQLRVRGFRPFQWLSTGAVVVPLVRVSGMDIDVFRDKRIPRPEGLQPEMPWHLLDKAPLSLQFDSLMLEDARAQYSEHVEDSPQPGTIYFEQLQAKVLNWSNRYAPADSQELTIKASAKLMGEAPLAARWTIPYHSPDDAYSYVGFVEPMDLRLLNPTLGPIAFVKVRKGKMQGLQLNIDATDDQATGQVEMIYRRLKLDIVDKEDQSRRGFGNSITSFLVNSFVLKSNNKADKNTRVGEVYFERDKDKSFLNYWWKSVFSGIMSSVGVDPRKRGDGRRDDELEITEEE